MHTLTEADLSILEQILEHAAETVQAQHAPRRDMPDAARSFLALLITLSGSSARCLSDIAACSLAQKHDARATSGAAHGGPQVV